MTDAKTRRGAVGIGTPKSQFEVGLSNAEDSQSQLDLQARKLRRAFFLCHETARVVATLAYGVVR